MGLGVGLGLVFLVLGPALHKLDGLLGAEARDAEVVEAPG